MSDHATRSLYKQLDFPILQNRTYDSMLEAKACPTGDIHLVENLDTGLVYNRSFQADRIVYDNNYQNEQAHSPIFRLHLERVANIVSLYLGKSGLVEIGCGKGYFLEMLLEAGFDIIGYDPAYEGNNRRIVPSFFEPGQSVGSCGLILRHVLEHIQGPYDFLEKLREANGGRGNIYIEVPCLDWICEHKAWFDIFYEHVNYFRLADFERMFGRILDSGHLFEGQYIYVVADLSTLRKPVLNNNGSVVFPSEIMPKYASQGGKVVWGGASKGVIFSLLMERAGHPITTVIDINPTKQKRFLPVTGLQVQSPEVALPKIPEKATIYVMNSNYLEEIRYMSRNAYTYIGIDNG